MPSKPKEPTEKTRNVDRMRYFVDKSHYYHFMTRSGIDPETDTRVDLRICNNHVLEKFPKDVEWYDKHNNKRIVKTIMDLPTMETIISPDDVPNKRDNKGIGRDRYINRQIMQKIIM
jgi:hypothetical protein